MYWSHYLFMFSLSPSCLQPSLPNLNVIISCHNHSTSLPLSHFVVFIKTASLFKCNCLPPPFLYAWIWTDLDGNRQLSTWPHLRPMTTKLTLSLSLFRNHLLSHTTILYRFLSFKPNTLLPTSWEDRNNWKSCYKLFPSHLPIKSAFIHIYSAFILLW